MAFAIAHNGNLWTPKGGLRSVLRNGSDILDDGACVGATAIEEGRYIIGTHNQHDLVVDALLRPLVLQQHEGRNRQLTDFEVALEQDLRDSLASHVLIDTQDFFEAANVAIPCGNFIQVTHDEFGGLDRVLRGGRHIISWQGYLQSERVRRDPMSLSSSQLTTKFR